MTAPGFLKRLEARYPWGLLGAAVGVAGLAVGAYGWLHERRPNVMFEVISEANVLDVHTALPDLRILFRGEDIQKENLNLRILRLRVANTGEADISQGLYDVNEPWGFKVRGGRALEIRLVEASSEYLFASVAPVLVNDSSVHLSKVILERGAAFSVELLVLHPSREVPEVVPIGKVAGVQRIEVLRGEAGRRESFWGAVLAGSVWTHLARFVGYILVLLVAAVIIGGAGSWIGNRLSGHKRRARARQLVALLNERKVPPGSARDAVVDLYAFGGKDALLASLRLAGFDSRNLAHQVRRFERFQRMGRRTHDDWRLAVDDALVDYDAVFAGHVRPDQLLVRAQSRRTRLRTAVLQMLLAEGLVVVEGNDARVDPELVNVLTVAVHVLGLIAPVAPGEPQAPQIGRAHV